MATNGSDMAHEMPPAETASVNTNIITLTRFLTEEQSKHKEATGDFT
jgi:fructose-1,6-bisphosphatase I